MSNEGHSRRGSRTDASGRGRAGSDSVTCMFPRKNQWKGPRSGASAVLSRSVGAKVKATLVVSAVPSGKAGTSAGGVDGSVKNSQKVDHRCSAEEWKNLSNNVKDKICSEGKKKRQKERQQRLGKQKKEKELMTKDIDGACVSGLVTWGEDVENRLNLLAARPKRKARPIDDAGL